LPLSLRFRF